MARNGRMKFNDMKQHDANDWKSRLGMVYSTDPDFRYTTDEVEEPETLPPDKQTLRVWLDRKTISVERPEKGLEALFDPALPQKVAAGFTALKPVYAFFLRAAEYGEEDGRIE